MKEAFRPHLACSIVNAPPALFGIAWYIAYCLLIAPVVGDSFSLKFEFYGAMVALFQILYSVMTLGFGNAGIPGSLFTFVVLMLAPIVTVTYVR